MTAVPVGAVAITVTTVDGGFTDAVQINVTALVIEVTGVSIDQADQNLMLGETLLLTATVEPAAATNPSVTWSWDNAAVATVGDHGLVSAVGMGTVAITVTTVDGHYQDTVSLTNGAHCPAPPGLRFHSLGDAR